MKVFMRHKNDCYTACLATLLGLPYEDVPRFFDDNNELLGDWSQQVSAFLLPRELQILQFDSSPEILNSLRGLIICAGPSYTPEFKELEHFHAVIYKDGKLWHDPKPNPVGVIEPKVIDILVPIYKDAEC